ncbi:phage major capsid protein [Streptomyces violascens]|uniref:phage major capsid protein n=1 Tax=Streptomyces violascens TaxID=67381 RepID=UPI00364F862C
MAGNDFTTQAASGLLTGGSSGADPVLKGHGVFVPELWTAQLLQDLEDNLILGSAEITNRNFEGEFRREGDRIRIPHFIDTVEDKGLIKAYGEIGDKDHAALEYIPMTVGKGSSFHIEIDALHQLQTKSGIDLMSELVRQRGRQAAVSIDKILAQTLTAAVSGKDLNGAETMPADASTLPALHGKIDTVTPNALETEVIGVYDYVVAMLENLDLKNAPDSRYLFISPRLRSLLLRDPKFIDAAHFGAGPVMPSGVIGTILGIPVRVSNTLGNARAAAGTLVKGRRHDEFKGIDMFMGSTSATSLVIPFAQMEAYKPEKSFTDAIKSRVIYDAKVIRPEQLLVATGVEKTIQDHNKIAVEKNRTVAVQTTPAK